MTLGISLNSRILGMAVIQNQILVDYRTRLFKDHWTPEKYKRILDGIIQCIEEQAITSVALVVPPRHYSNRETRALLAKIPLLCKRRKLPLTTFKVKDLYVLVQNDRAKKRALMQALALLFPELSIAQKKELANRKRYYTKLFEAVAAAALQQRSCKCGEV